MGSSIPSDERFLAIVDALRDAPGVTYTADEPGGKQRFGASALKVNGKIFVMPVKGRLVVKLPRQQVAALVAAGAGERFDPGHGRIMKEWMSVESASVAEWLRLARDAMEFVAAKR